MKLEKSLQSAFDQINELRTKNEELKHEVIYATSECQKMSSLFEAVTALWSSLRYIGQVLWRSNSAMLFGNLGRAGTDKHRSGQSIAGTCTF